MKSETWKNRGITLVALVITIIVLLILAGITITLTIGQNGIINRAKEAGKNYLDAQGQELEGLNNFDKEAENILTNMPGAGENTSKDPSKEIIGDGSVVEGVSSPKLTGNMIPVIYDNSITTANGNIPAYWKKANNEKEWYSYQDTAVTGPGTSRWANAITTDGSMWVWIPRYAYKITSGYHSNTAGTIEIKFIDTKNQFLDGTREEITDDPTKSGAGQNIWLVHPAFTANADNGGGFGELEGVWVGKFETTGTIDNLTVKPAEASLKGQNVNDMWKLAQNKQKASFGETVDLKQHMAKNSEWGMTVYLAHSNYGTKGTKMETNTNENYYTGGSDKTEIIYENNIRQSTTLNPYGVYDLNGGSDEYVASYLKNGHQNLETYGVDLTKENISTAYKTIYNSITTTGSNTQSDDYGLLNYTNIKRGDAIWETSNTYSSNTSSWQATSAKFPYASNPFFLRGGSATVTGAGIFHFKYGTGSGYASASFRMVMNA